MRFSKIIVLGNGRIACDCIELLLQNVDKEFVLVIESQYNSLSMLKTKCEQCAVSFFIEEDKVATIELLNRLTEKGTLIISANNEILIPANICNMEGVEIINFHYGYLPYYRGMNIPSWVIYNGESFTGVTWHYINEKIDDGDIICQEKIAISEKTTAIHIVQEGMDLGKELFGGFISFFLKTRPETILNKSDGYKVFNRKILPGNGTIDESMSGEEISRLLRAFDYGPMNVMGQITIETSEGIKAIKRYKIDKNCIFLCGNLKGEGNYQIVKDNYNFEFLC